MSNTIGSITLWLIWTVTANTIIGLIAFVVPNVIVTSIDNNQVHHLKCCLFDTM